MSEKLLIDKQEAIEVMGLMQAMVQFFHNRLHYEDVHKFGELIYPELSRLAYGHVYKWLPDDEWKEIDALEDILPPEQQVLHQKLNDLYAGKLE